MPSIPASQIVAVTPSVLAAGGRALDLSGLLLTTDTRVPLGTPLTFVTAADVIGFFGPLTPEAQAASIYFQGFLNAHKRPGALLFVQHNLTAVAAYVRSAINPFTLTTLRSFSGTIAVTVDGVVKTSVVDLSTATSFSAAAQIIGTKLGAACSFDPIQGVFQITSGTAGAASAVSYASGDLADTLGFSQPTGALLSLGADPATPVGTMASVLANTHNWALFTTLFEPDLGGKLGFAQWTSAQGGNYGYVPWDTDDTATQFGAAGCFGVLTGKRGADYNGVASIYEIVDHAVFTLGWAASLDYGQHNGRATAAFRSQSGLVPTVTNATDANALKSNGYNFVGAYATANDQFTFLYPGQIAGPFLWLDSFVNGIWMTNALQLANMVLLTNNGSIPYNESGYALIRAASRDVIDQALNFGAIRAGVKLSQAQAAEVNAAAGVDIADTITARGWYYQVLDPTPEVRQARGTPQCTLFFTDGQSVQTLQIATVAVQ